MFYGQDFQDLSYRNAIAGPYIIRNPVDIALVPSTFVFDDIARLYEQLYADSSNITVHDVVNIVFIYRSLFVEQHDPDQP